VTIHRSSNALVLNLPLDECIDNTSNQFRERRKGKEMKEKLKQLIKSQTKAKKFPLENMNWVLSSPLLEMHE
jgi:hypothetical protein